MRYSNDHGIGGRAFLITVVSFGVRAPNKGASESRDCDAPHGQGIVCEPFRGHAVTCDANRRQNMGKAAFDILVTLAHGLLADARSQPLTVRIDCSASLIVAISMQIAFARAGARRCASSGAAVEVFQHITWMDSLCRPEDPHLPASA